MNGHNLLSLAANLARVMHEGQSRKGSGEPYFNHVERVANDVAGWRAKTVAYLHDLMEDTAISLSDLRRMRFPDDVVEAVDALTRRSWETYAEFIDRCANSGSRLAWTVKLADLKDNLRDIEELPGGSGMREKRYAAPYARFVELVSAA